MEWCDDGQTDGRTWCSNYFGSISYKRVGHLLSRWLLVFAILKWRRSVGPFHFFSFDSFSPPLLLSTGRRSNDDTNIFYWWLWRNLFYFQNRVTLQRVARNGRKKERKKIIFYVDAADWERERIGGARSSRVVSPSVASIKDDGDAIIALMSQVFFFFFFLYTADAALPLCIYANGRADGLAGRPGFDVVGCYFSKFVCSQLFFVFKKKKKTKKKSLFLPKMGISLIVFLFLSWWVRQSLAESQTGRVLKKKKKSIEIAVEPTPNGSY